MANSQSSILTLLVPPLLLWGLRSRRLWKFCLCCLLGFGLLYFTGTLLTYYGAILICCAFLALLVLRRPAAVLHPLGSGLGGPDPVPGRVSMAERQALTADSYSIYQEKADAIMGGTRTLPIPQGRRFPRRSWIRSQVYTQVYGQPGLYGATLLEDLIEEFGLEGDGAV